MQNRFKHLFDTISVVAISIKNGAPRAFIMNQPTLTIEQCRRYDQWATEKYGIPSLLLMENAARGCCDVLLAEKPKEPIVVLCGGGNNGGDGYAIARRLDLLGFSVCIFALKRMEELTGDAATNARIVNKTRISVSQFDSQSADTELREALAKAEWIVDALLGTGVTGDPRSPYDRVIELANDVDARRFAVDIPSGLGGDIGEVGVPTFQADLTCTFVAAKTGLLADAARPFVGRLKIVDIGAPPELLQEVIKKPSAP